MHCVIGFRLLKQSAIHPSNRICTIMEAAALLNPLQHKIHGTLDSSPYVSTRQVRVETSEGWVRLEGTVGSFFQKQMAQELIRRVDGVDEIENQLKVNWA